MQQQIERDTCVGLGDILQLQSMGHSWSILGQKKNREKITKSTPGLECVLTLQTASEPVTDARELILSIHIKHPPNSM